MEQQLLNHFQQLLFHTISLLVFLALVLIYFAFEGKPPRAKFNLSKNDKVKVASNDQPQPKLAQNLCFFINCKNFGKKSV